MVNHAEVHRGARKPLKTCNRNHRHGIQHLPFKHRTREHRGVHVEEAVHQRLAPAEKGRSKHVRGPIPFTVARAPPGRLQFDIVKVPSGIRHGAVACTQAETDGKVWIVRDVIGDGVGDSSVGVFLHRC